MNQILITGDEYIKQPKGQGRNVLEIKRIVIFFSITILLFGICLITGSVYAKEKINSTVEANAKPVLNVNMDEVSNTLALNITHIRGIETVTYRWNNEQENVINGNNQKSIQTIVPLLGGQNVLEVNIKDENGQTVTYRNTYTSTKIPEIRLEAISNGIKMIITSEENIDYISYQWDNEAEETIEVGEKEYQGTINAPKGQHTLKITAVDVNGNEGTKTQAIVGDEAPTLTIKADRINGKTVFVIDAEDDQEITKVEITLNNGIEQVINVNDKEYHEEIEMVEGENKIKVVVYNLNNLETTKGGKFNN